MSALFDWWPFLHFNVFLPPYLDYDLVIDFTWLDTFLGLISPYLTVAILLAVVSFVLRYSGKFGRGA